MSSREYLKAAIVGVGLKVHKEGRRVCTNAKILITSNYTPELDDTAELKGEDITYSRTDLDKYWRRTKHSPRL